MTKKTRNFQNWLRRAVLKISLRWAEANPGYRAINTYYILGQLRGPYSSPKFKEMDRTAQESAVEAAIADLVKENRLRKMSSPAPHYEVVDLLDRLAGLDR